MKLFQRHKILLIVGWLCLFVTPANAEPATITALIVSAAISAASAGLSILAQYLAPKPKPVEVGKGNPQAQASEYGVVIPRVRGTMGQVAGQIIDAFPFDANGKFGREVRNVIPGQGGKRKTPDTVNYTYYGSIAVMLTDNQIQGVTKIMLDTDVFYTGAATGSEVTATPAGCAGIHIVLGTESQLPDATFVAYHGAGQVPAYRGCSVLYIYDLDLTKYYNRIPQITCEVVADDGDVAEIIAAEMQLAGLTSDDYDLTEVEGVTIDGLYIGQRTSVRSGCLEPIALAKQIDFVEIDGKITALLRARDVEVTIPVEDLGAYDYDQAGQPDAEKPFATETTRIQDQDIPRAVDVVYFDTGRDHEKNTQSFTRQIFESYERETLTLPIAMTANEANRVAKVRAVTNWTEREPVKFSLPPTYLKYAPGTVATIETLAGREMDVMIEKMDIGIPGGKIDCVGRAFLKEAYTQTGEGDVGLDGSGTREGGYQSVGGGGDVVGVPVDTLMIFSNLDGLIPAYAGLSGFYVWVTIDPADTRDEASWSGVTIYQDVAGVGTVRAVSVQGAPSIFGATIAGSAGTLANGTGIDTVNTVDIDLEYGTLESIEEEDFDAGRPLNLFVIGSEVVQARDITQPDVGTYPNRYRLAHLRRGLRNTTAAASTHTASEQAALLDSAVSFISISPEDAGDTLGYYAAGPGQDPLDTTRYDYAYGAPPTSLNRYEEDFGDGVTEVFTIAHFLNSTSLSVSFYDYSGSIYYTITDANNIEVTQSPAPTSNHVTIIKV